MLLTRHLNSSTLTPARPQVYRHSSACHTSSSLPPPPSTATALALSGSVSLAILSYLALLLGSPSFNAITSTSLVVVSSSMPLIL
ncbi:hypothetical protein BGZ93_002934, partial [Podila epicladia]